MINTNLSYAVKSYEDYSLQNDYLFLSSVFEKIAKYSDDDIIITDNNLQILFSNSDIITASDDVMKKLQLRKKQLADNSANILRHIKTQFGKLHLEIFITPIYTNSYDQDGYLFIIKDLTYVDTYKNKYENLISFLKHELKTPILSQIMALNLVMKNDNYKDLLPEVLNSCEITHRMINNIIEESSLEKEKLIINKKDILLNVFVQNLENACKSFLAAKSNKLITENFLNNFKISIDPKTLHQTLVNIIFQINERCFENQSIKVSFMRKKRVLNIIIESKTKLLDKKLFSNITAEKPKKFNKIGHNNGLIYAGEIINAHQGKIITEEDFGRSFVKIYIPI